MSGRIAVGLSTVLAVVLAGAAQAGRDATKIVHFRVFTSTGKVVGVRVTHTLHGSCFSGSIGLPRPGAWRCMVGNEILDPCLEAPAGPKAGLVCVFGNQAVRLRLVKPLPMRYRNHPEKSFFAWRLVLSTGDVCQRFTGTAAGVVQGQGLVYGCTSGGTTTDPNRSRPRWTVRYLKKGISPFKLERLTQLKLLTVAQAIG